MKRAMIGGFLTLIGTIWCLAALLTAGVNVENVDSWHTPPGRFGTALLETGMMAPFVLAVLLLLIGLVILGIEYFRKDQ